MISDITTLRQSNRGTEQSLILIIHPMSEISEEINSPILTDYFTPTQQNKSLDDVNWTIDEEEYHTPILVVDKSSTKYFFRFKPICPIFLLPCNYRITSKCLGHININSIRKKFDMLAHLINRKIDIFLISESKIDHTFHHLSWRYKTIQFFLSG